MICGRNGGLRFLKAYRALLIFAIRVFPEHFLSGPPINPDGCHAKGQMMLRIR